MIPVVISGGSGTRLWPVSRQSMPKQFCDFLDESLFAKTLKRVKPLGSPWTVTVRDLKVLTEKSLRDLGLPAAQTVYEPFGNNTAPAIALLCRVLELKGLTNEIVGVFPADQLVGDDKAFHAAVELGAGFATEGEIVTLGVKPTSPATGYGYIETSGPVKSGERALKAVGFREKPNLDTARGFLSQGGFFWNAGMFIFKVAKIIELLKTHAPDVWSPFAALTTDLSNLEDIYRAIKANRKAAISIDYAVMEKLPGHVCIPCDFAWSDLGSWEAVADELKSRPAHPTVTDLDGKTNFVFPVEGKTYGLIGVSDLIVVDTPDALLLAKRGETERVKEVVERLKASNNPAGTQHRFDIRPWGRYEILSESNDYKAKVIIVDPGMQISYQSHHHRAEHWIVTSGTGEVVLDGKTTPVQPGSHVMIPLQAKHRIRNTGKKPLHFVEVQLGTSFDEADIIRYEDDFQRV